MQRIIIMLSIFLSTVISAQDNTKWLRAFPITDYIVDLNDSVRVVQIEMPDGLGFKEKQIGMVWGTFNTSKDEAVQKGYGRCQLIKGNYYYFSISSNESGLPLQKGDLVYTFMDTTSIYYGVIPKLAGHFIRLQDVRDNNFYDRYNVFLEWTEDNERSILDSIVHDIRFTGQYFLENDPSMNKLIESGTFKGQYILNVMQECSLASVRDFFNYMLARPRLYAGKQWKISELFATWITNGAPMVKE